MRKQELKLILSEHSKWLIHDGGFKANLRGADLCEADLRGANLRGADLCEADLQGADLQGADLDYSCWPLWCGGLDAKIDDTIAIQLLYHLVRSVLFSPYTTKGIKKTLSTKTILNYANKFHRGELPRIKVGDTR